MGCLPDDLSIEKATEISLGTWDREPLFHISSPKDGWNASNIKKHHDFIDINDFPPTWLSMDITVEVEAKAKEVAIGRLMAELNMARGAYKMGISDKNVLLDFPPLN